MQLDQEDDGVRGAFVLTEAGHRVGVLTYEHGPAKVVTADHTWVDDAHRGGGVAGKLALALATWAKVEGFSIEPTCSYVARWLDSHAEYTSLRA